MTTPVVTKKEARKRWHGRQHHISTLAVWSWNYLATLAMLSMWFEFAPAGVVFPFLTVGTPVVYGAAIGAAGAVNFRKDEED